MSTTNFKSTSADSDEFFTSLATALETKVVNDTIKLLPRNGNGSIVRKTISNEIVVLSWDVLPAKNMSFIKYPSLSADRNQLFIISYLLNSPGITIHSQPLRQSFRPRANRNILFVSDDADISFELPAGEEFKLISICVPLSWLKTELSDASDAFQEFVERLGERKLPTFFTESSPVAEYKILKELRLNESDDNNHALYLKAKVYSLVADFFLRMFNRSGKDVLESRLQHHEKMVEVETLLKHHLERTLPDMSTIARQMAMSLSTLKRHFKMVFGKNIYDYYLEMKMENAMRLLTERPLSVNEVATMLGYEKVSCFIDMFKKHHGFSPGTLRKRTA